MAGPRPHLTEPIAIQPASRHSAFLIAALTKMRSTSGSRAAVRMSSVRSWVHTSGSIGDIRSSSTSLSAWLARPRKSAGTGCSLATCRRSHAQRPHQSSGRARCRYLVDADARQPHDLPRRAVDRQRHGASEASVGVEADGARGERGLVLRANSSFAGVDGESGCASGGICFSSRVPGSCGRAGLRPATQAGTTTIRCADFRSRRGVPPSRMLRRCFGRWAMRRAFVF
jgi:hypothetical protein